jgi:pimeloyl-ACP methyl ester carboxylesterase
MVDCAPSPVIPEVLTTEWDDKIAEAHGRLATMSLDTFLEQMPHAWRLPEDGTVSFVNMSPEEDHDPHSAIVVPFPFGAGWSPHMAMRMQMVQESLPEPRRLVVLPNNSLEKRAYNFSTAERAKIGGSGDFSPLVERQMRTLGKLGIEHVQILGYSQGAAVGATTLRVMAKNGDFALGASGLMDPPNATKRSRYELMHDFVGDGIKPFCAAVNGAAIPMLTEVQRSRVCASNLARQAWRSGAYTAMNAHLLPQNRALKDGFRHAQFIPDVEAALREAPELRLHVIRAGNSRIMPSEAVEDLEKLGNYDGRLTTLTVDGFGHEMAANLVVHTLLARMALTDVQRRSVVAV